MLRDSFGNQVSEADLPLPLSWERAPHSTKVEVIKYLRAPAIRRVPFLWSSLPSYDQARIRRHLAAVGSVPSSGSYERGVLSHHKAEAALRAHRAERPRTLAGEWVVDDVPPATPTSYGLYPKPNGGKRMLPSLYTTLDQYWVRGDGRYKSVESMDSGHIHNTIKLLKESHGNVTARATDLLGRMALHYRNQPHIVSVLETACAAMQRVEVDEMYPIFAELAKELVENRPRVEDLDPPASVEDDDLEPWNDMQRERQGPYGAY